MARLYYQGHASFRLVSEQGVVAYVDPYAGDGYDLPADLILVTHQHKDHNCLGLVKRKPRCRVITNAEALTAGVYKTFHTEGWSIEAVPATNEQHDPRECVGYIITLDGIKVYAAGDTSETDAMKEMIWQHLDYALLPMDGEENMDTIAASICAARIGATHTIPIHTKIGGLFSEEVVRRFDIPGRLIMRPGDEIEL